MRKPWKWWVFGFSKNESSKFLIQKWSRKFYEAFWLFKYRKWLAFFLACRFTGIFEAVFCWDEAFLGAVVYLSTFLASLGDSLSHISASVLSQFVAPGFLLSLVVNFGKEIDPNWSQQSSRIDPERGNHIQIIRKQLPDRRWTCLCLHFLASLLCSMGMFGFDSESHCEWLWFFLLRDSSVVDPLINLYFRLILNQWINE